MTALRRAASGIRMGALRSGRRWYIVDKPQKKSGAAEKGHRALFETEHAGANPPRHARATHKLSRQTGPMRSSATEFPAGFRAAAWLPAVTPRSATARGPG